MHNNDDDKIFALLERIMLTLPAIGGSPGDTHAALVLALAGMTMFLLPGSGKTVSEAVADTHEAFDLAMAHFSGCKNCRENINRLISEGTVFAHLVGEASKS